MTVHQQTTLEDFIAESVRRGLALRPKYSPTRFLQMVADHSRQLGAKRGLRTVITKLVESGEEQTGFSRLRDAGLIDWTIESAVLKFKSEFSSRTVEFAKARLLLFK